MADKQKILVVDNEPINLVLLEAMLIPFGYEVLTATSGVEALEIVQKARPDLVLLDIMMPGMDGFEVTRRLKGTEETRTIPVVMVTALRDVSDRVTAIDVGADDYLTKPVDKIELRARVRSLLKVKKYNDHMRDYQQNLKMAVFKRTAQLQRALNQVQALSLEAIYILTRAAEYKDEETGAHIRRMSHYAAAVARQMGVSQETEEEILYAAPMHDIGKIGVPDSVLLKPGKLAEHEWEVMKKHSQIGADILTGSEAGFLKLAREIALGHHERWDGRGYPDGRKGTEIPLSARIVSVADVFDALTSSRPYRKVPIPLDKAFSIIREGVGKGFDPEIVEAFLSMETEILSIRDRFKDEGQSLLRELSRQARGPVDENSLPHSLTHQQDRPRPLELQRGQQGPELLVDLGLDDREPEE